MIGHIPSTEKVKKVLYRGVHEYLSGTGRLPTALDGTTTLWLWDDNVQKLISVAADEPTAAAGNAARIAQALSEVDPADERLARMKAIARLQRDKLAVGLDQPINPATATLVLTYAPQGEGRHDVDFIEEILDLSLSRGYIPAAIAAAEILGSLSVLNGGHADLIQRRAPQPHPLVGAASHPDRRLRLAATRALLQLDPYEVYAGASAVPTALKYFANVTGKPRALVGDSRPQRRYLMASLLNENGHETDAFRTSTDAFLAAARRPDYIVALISFAIGPRGIKDLMHEIRSDPRTADLPIGLIADPKSIMRAEYFAANDPLTAAFVVPRDATTMQQRIDQLVTMAGSRFVAHEHRMQHAAEAMQMIATISEKPGVMYDLNGFETVLEGGLYFSELAEPAARALGNLGSASAQRALIDAASQPRMPMPSRSAAAQAFAASVKRRGVGLTVQQIQRQAKRYDQGADTTADNEAILWSILEAIQNAQE